MTRRIATALAIALLVASGSCRDTPTAPTTPSNGNDPNHLLGLPIFGGSQRLLYCPSSESQSSSGVIDAAGGTLSLGGTSVTFPLGALLGPANVQLSIPAGQYMEVDLTAASAEDGQPIHVFDQPVVVTIDYSRCNRLATLLRVLSVWNIDTDTKALLENMGGIDNKLDQSIAFISKHFSGFAIAY